MSSDVIILGAGMAGLTAAYSAATRGATVTVLDAAPSIGGSAALSSGTFWSFANVAHLRAQDNGQFLTHGEYTVTHFDDAMRDLAGLGGRLGAPIETTERRVQRLDLPWTFLRICETIGSKGGDIRVGINVTEIRREGTDFVVFVGVNEQPLRARSIILATGGRAADQRERLRLTGSGGSMPRGNAFAQGAGIAIGRAFGGKVNEKNIGFYGHLFPDGVEPVSALDLSAFSLMFSGRGVLFDQNGELVPFEVEDHANAAALARRRSDGILLWSEAVQDAAKTEPMPSGHLVDRWEYASRRGGLVSVVDSIDAAIERGYNYGVVLPREALERQDVATRLGEGRIFIARVVVAVTQTYGGLVADTNGQLVNETGDPVAGVYIAGGDLSDIYDSGYGGGLAAAVTTGRRAGNSAAQFARAAN